MWQYFVKTNRRYDFFLGGGGGNHKIITLWSNVAPNLQSGLELLSISVVVI